MSTGVLRYFHPVLPSKSLGRKPVQVTVAGQTYVLFRDHTQRVAALADQCPHRRAPLSQGWVRPDGRLACPYHGWNFDADGNGRSPSSPALRQCDALAYQVVERYGYLWIAERDTLLSMFPAVNSDGFEFAGAISTLFRAPMDVTLDNITEDEHFAYVHATFGWDESGWNEVSLVTTRSSDQTEVRYTGPQRASFWAPLGGVRSGDKFHNSWYTRLQPVHTVYTFGWRDPKSNVARPVTTRAAVYLVPETQAITRVHMFLFLNVSPSLQYKFRRIIFALAKYISTTELKRDAWLMSHVGRAPSTLRGMRLTRFDEALIHNRRLLQTLYWGTETSRCGKIVSSDSADSPRSASGTERLVRG